MSAKIFQYFLVFIAAVGLNLSVDAAGFILPNDSNSLYSAHKFPKLDLPVQSAPAPIDRELPDENESEEDIDSDVSFLTEQQSHYNLFDFPSGLNRIKESSSSVHNRSAVPLFVLYHSWKSFMA